MTKDRASHRAAVEAGYASLPDYVAAVTEDEADIAVARQRLQEINDNPDSLVHGDELKAALDEIVATVAVTNLERDKVTCHACGWQGLKVELDSVDDPRPKVGQVADIWCICPECRTPENIQPLCDEPGCDRDATCGTPTEEHGYRWTCGTHAPWNKDHKVEP